MSRTCSTEPNDLGPLWDPRRHHRIEVSAEPSKRGLRPRRFAFGDPFVNQRRRAIGSPAGVRWSPPSGSTSAVGGAISPGIIPWPAQGRSAKPSLSVRLSALAVARSRWMVGRTAARPGESRGGRQRVLGPSTILYAPESGLRWAGAASDTGDCDMTLCPI
jgi:hypothetical protein